MFLSTKMSSFRHSWISLFVPSHLGLGFVYASVIEAQLLSGNLVVMVVYPQIPTP